MSDILIMIVAAVAGFATFFIGMGLVIKLGKNIPEKIKAIYVILGFLASVYLARMVAGNLFYFLTNL